VNNAGVGVGAPPEEQTLEQWRWLMSINLDGVFLGTKHAILAMKEHPPKGGSIINLSSIEGLVGDPNLGAYNASKGGVRLYTKSVALYCAKSGPNIPRELHSSRLHLDSDGRELSQGFRRCR